MGERIEPWRVSGRRVAAWRRTDGRPWEANRVHLGRLDDGRWWAETNAEPCGWAYATEAEARAAAEAMRAEGEWEPCSPNPTQDDPRWSDRTGR